MITRCVVCSEWATFDGAFSMEFEEASVEISLISEGVSVFVVTERRVLVYVGSGRADLSLNVGEAFSLHVIGEGATSVLRVGDRVVSYPADASLSVIQPERPQMSAEVRAVMDKMNRNAIVREQAMLRALGRFRETM